MYRALFIVFAFWLSAVPMAQEACPVNITFETPDDTQAWQAVNDGVMGGRSRGGPSFEAGVMRFAGDIDTNGGGFSSVRAYVEPGWLLGTSGVRLRVRTDRRQYQLTLRSDARYRGRRVAFRADIPSSPSGEWAEVTVPFSALSPSLFGRSLRGPIFDPQQAHSIGIILADGRDGPFKIEIDWLRACEQVVI